MLPFVEALLIPSRVWATLFITCMLTERPFIVLLCEGLGTTQPLDLSYGANRNAPGNSQVATAMHTPPFGL